MTMKVTLVERSCIVLAPLSVEIIIHLSAFKISKRLAISKCFLLRYGIFKSLLHSIAT